MTTPIQKYAAELVGTFALVFVGTSVVAVTGQHQMDLGARLLMISFGFGFTLITLIFALGGVSGAHFNPAVTIAMYFAAKIPAREAAAYIVSQLIGGILASVTLLGMMSGFTGWNLGTDGLGANGVVTPATWSAVLISEIVLTMLFLLVIFSATDGRNLPPGFAALPIGVFLFVAHLIGAAMGDASLNPARSTGPALVEAIANPTPLSLLWLFWVGPIIGALLGMFAHRFIWGTEKSKSGSN